MKSIIFLTFLLPCFSQDKLGTADEVLKSSIVLDKKLNESLVDLENELKSDDAFTIIYKTLIVEKNLLAIFLLQERAQKICCLVKNQTKDHFTSKYFSDSIKDERLNSFSKKSYKYAEDKIKSVEKRLRSIIKDYQKKEKKIKTRSKDLAFILYLYL